MYTRTPITILVGFMCMYRLVTTQRKDVTLPILVSSTGRLKMPVRNAVIEIKRSGIVTMLRRAYNIDIKPIELDTGSSYRQSDYSPDGILRMFNDSIVKNSINSVLVIQIQEVNTASTEYMMTMLEQLGLPVLSFNPFYPGSLEKVPDRKVLQFAPTVYHEAQGMLLMLEKYNWTHFTIVTSTKTNYFDFIGSVEKFVKERNAEIVIPPRADMKILETVVFDIGDEDDDDIIREMFRSYLRRKAPKENRIFLLHTQSKYAKAILEAATLEGLTRKEYQWILTSSASGLVQGIAHRSYPVGVVGFTYSASSSDESAVIKDALVSAGTVWTRTMMLLSRKKVQLFPNYSSPDRWSYGAELYQQMQKTVVKTENPVEFTDNGMNKYTSLQIINCQEQSDSRGRSTKKWITVGKLAPRREGYNVETQIELQGISWPGNEPFPPLGRPARRFFKIATLAEAPYVMYRSRDNQTGVCNYPAVDCRIIYNATEHGNDTTLQNGTVKMCCTGLSIDLLRTFSDKMKFDFDLFEVPDKAFGIQDKITGEWSGLIKFLKEGKSDMVMTSLQITPSRSKAINFSMPYLETGTTIVVSLTKGAISATAVLEPYDYPAWCLILVFSVHSIGASIFIFEWLSPAGLNQGTTPMREHKFSLFRSFWLIWAMLFGAAVSTDNPRGVSSRFLGNVWALFALVFLASYTANLAAFMITKETFYDLSGIQDWRLTNPLSHKPRPFKFATVPNGSTEENLRETRPSMYKYMQQFNKHSVKEAIAALKAQEINAFIYDATPLYYQVGIDPQCNLRTVGQAYAMTGYGVGFPPDVDQDLVKEVDKIILELQEEGELERLRKFWLAGACHSKNNQKRSSDELGILNFTSAFILLAAGIVLGGLLLILEHMYFRFGRKCLREYDKCGCCALVSLSMGKSLTFEQTIMEAIDLHKKHKCTDPLCETQLWKAKHELDLALLKIQKLSRELGAIKQAPAIRYRADNKDSKLTDENLTSKSSQKVAENSNGEMRQRRRDSTLRRSPSYNNAIVSGNDLSNGQNDKIVTTDINGPQDHKHVFGEGEV